MKTPPKKDLELIFLVCFLVTGCIATNELPQTSTEQPTSVARTPSVILETATATREGVRSPSPTVTPSVTETLLPAITSTLLISETETPYLASELSMGWLFSAGINWYGWFELTAQATASGLVLNSRDYYHIHSSKELRVTPGQHIKFEFSHYADLMAYTTDTAPGELWISDVTYREPKKVFVDSDNRFTDSAFTRGSLKLAWSPDDLQLFLYHLTQPELSLVYHIATGELEAWYWTCNSIILSPQSGRLATLCPRMPGVSLEQKAFAIMEWGGMAWFTDTLPNKPFLQPTTEGITLWQWSLGGDYVAYFDPDDPEGYLLIADFEGNVQQFLPGISVFNEPEQEDLPSYIYNKMFVWARNAPILLVMGYGQSGQLCPPYVTPFHPDVYIPVWPCWQAVDTNTGEVFWSEVDLAVSLGESTPRVSTSDVAISPDGKMIALRAYNPDRIVVADLGSTQATIIFDNPVDNLYWTFASTH